jgi:hypothetical protein
VQLKSIRPSGGNAVTIKSLLDSSAGDAVQSLSWVYKGQLLYDVNKGLLDAADAKFVSARC